MARKTQRNPVDAQITQVKLRLPESTRLMLLAHAVRNSRSLNSEIVHRLEASLAEGSGTTMIARAIVRDLDPTLLDAIAKEHHDNAARAKGATRGVKQPSGFSVTVATAQPGHRFSYSEELIAPEEYRLFAGRCLEVARATADEQPRAAMLQMAQVWLRLADETEAVPLELALRQSALTEDNHKPVLRKLPRMIASYEEGARIEKDPRKRETLWHIIKSLRNIEDGRESILLVLPRTIASYEQQALTEKDPRKLETILDVIESLKNIERDWKAQKTARSTQSAG
jgi:hypothetical protein